MDFSTPLQLALAGMLAELQEKLKTSTNPALAWISAHSATVNKAVAAALALLVTIGITSTWYVDPGSGFATFTLAGIPATWDAWSKVLMQAFTQYWLQKGWYRLAIQQSDSLGIVRR